MRDTVSFPEVVVPILPVLFVVGVAAAVFGDKSPEGCVVCPAT
jgi:hypothetical protein